MTDGPSPLRGVDVGVNLLVSVVVTGAAGYALDVWLGTLPLFLLVLGFLGFGAWFWQLVKMSRATDKNG